MSWIYLLKCITVFASVTLADICWANYFIKVSENKAFMSSVWSSGIMICGVYSVDSYVQDYYLAIPAIAGAFVGTFVSVWNKNRK